jgi:lysophospholipase L1-like esterase
MTARHLVRIGSIVGSATLVMVIGGSAATGSTPASPVMAGLGDSYASGLGAGSYYDDSGDCKRSSNAYAVLDSQRIGAALSFVACSGATTSDVEASQLGALSDSTTDVTITIGGNDIGFVDVITECALPSWASRCFGAIHDAQQVTKHVLPGKLDALYDDISAGAPNAKVVVVGYPRLFDGRDCSPLTFFSRKELARLNESADLLDQTIGKRAGAHGFDFVDPRSTFVGHAVCDPDAWLNNLTYPVEESFHPKASGQAAFAELVAGHL